MSARAAAALACVLLASLAAMAGAQRRPARGRSAQPSITATLECSACHTADGWSIGGAGGSDSGFDHSVTGFPLGGRHRTVPCSTCHAPGRAVSRECASCHADPHERRLGASCDSCHSASSWQSTDAIEMHRRTRLPLTGMHVLADCTECHRQSTGHRFTNVPSDCFACHADDYSRPGIHPSHDGTGGAPAFPRDCSVCHQPVGWAPAFVDPTALPRRAGLTAPEGHDVRFPVTFGPHRGADCASCHATAEVPQAVRCTGCHAHSAATIALQHASPVPTEGTACLSCHPGGSTR